MGVKIGFGDERGLKRAPEEAERLGFDSIWLSERVVTPLDKPHRCAAVTERLRLGTIVGARAGRVAEAQGVTERFLRNSDAARALIETAADR